jgi:hypothetical protein
MAVQVEKSVEAIVLYLAPLRAGQLAIKLIANCVDGTGLYAVLA